MRNWIRKLTLILTAVCALFMYTAAAGESMHREIAGDSFELQVTPGFGGKVTYGKLMPVRVTVRNFGDDFEGVLAMNAYIGSKEYDRYEKEIFVPAGSEREFELDIRVFAAQKNFTAELVKDGKTVCAVNAKPAGIINPAAMLIGVLSTRPQNLKNLDIDRDNDVLARYEMWQTVPLTADTFPESAAVLDSFGMLVIDDIDPAELSGKQQEALDEWLRGSKVLICGGGANAARNVPFFSAKTGLTLEEVSFSDSVIESLEKLIGRSVSGKSTACVTAVCGGAEPLVRDAGGRGLIWRSETGGGRIYTTAFAAGDSRLNSEGLMHYFWQQLLVNADQSVYSTAMYSSTDSFSGAFDSAGYAVPVEAKSFMPFGLAIVAGVPALGCVFWAALKRKDKQRWMWLILPALSVAAAAGILLLSTGAETNRPLAVIAENMVQDANGTIVNYGGVSAAAPGFGRHSYSMAGENLRVKMYDYVDYDEEEQDKRTEPDTLRTCYTEGGGNSVSTESLTPWTTVELVAELPSRISGKVNGSVWMEEDGLHGEIVNETDTAFGAGQLITSYGFASVPALAPGEKADILLVKKTFKDPLNPKYEDGGLYMENPSMYTVISSAVGYSGAYDTLPAEEAREREVASSMINGAVEALRQGSGNWSYGSFESAVFLYSAKPEGMEPSELKVDGQAVDRKTGLAMLTADLAFEAVGRTGVVFRSAGMDVPVQVETDENLTPTGEILQSGKTGYYYTLSDNPTFLFRPEGIAGVKIGTLQVVLESYYANISRVYALNAKTREWEEIKLGADIDYPERYLDEEGRLYVQFRSDSQDMYADIPMPMITLEGRKEHAED